MALHVWLAAGALAGGFEVAEQSAVAGGTANAGTARAGDPSAAWFVPAALADDGGLRVAGGLALASVAIEATGPDWQARSDSPLGTPPHLYASWARGRGVAGLAINAPFAGGVRWPADSPVRFDAIASEPRFFRLAPFVGGRLGLVRVAGGVHVDAGGLSVVKATDHVVAEGLASLSLRGAGIGVDLSAFVPVGDHLQLGASYKSRTRLALEGEADFDVPDPFAPTLPDQAASTTMLLPDRLAVGLAWDGGPYRVLIDGVLTTWSVHDQLTIDFAEPATADVVQIDHWRDTVAVRGGAEVDWRILTVRGGASVDAAPAPVTTLSPAAPDGTRIAGTVGVGAPVSDVVRLDGFVERLVVLARTATSEEAPSASYRGAAWVGGITVGAGF